MPTYADISFSYTGHYDNFHITIDGKRMNKEQFKYWLNDNSMDSLNLIVEGKKFDTQQFIYDLYGEDELYQSDHGISDVVVYTGAKPVKLIHSVYDLYNKDVLVNMRELFNLCGGQVNTTDESKVVFGNAGQNSVMVMPNSQDVNINGKKVHLKDATRVIDGMMYVPLSFVGDAFGYQYAWNKSSKAISIMGADNLAQNDRLNVVESSKYFTNDYFKMELSDDGILKLTGNTLSDDRWLMIDISDMKTRESVVNEIVKISGGYTKSINLKNKLIDGVYRIYLFKSHQQYGQYNGYYGKVNLVCKDGQMFFPRSEIYTQNYVHYMKNLSINPLQDTNVDEYIALNSLSVDEWVRISDLANDITTGCNSAYEKLKAINDWVTNNIYYDYDSYYSGSYGRNDAISTLENKRSVCRGYAELTNALCRVRGIPCKIVSGYGLGIGSKDKTWSDVQSEDSNHSWNEVFVDGRWVILDTTWNTFNKYENGQFINGNKRYIYFDPSIEMFSYDHKVMD